MYSVLLAKPPNMNTKPKSMKAHPAAKMYVWWLVKSVFVLQAYSLGLTAVLTNGCAIGLNVAQRQ